jgi:hypothetical protein
MGVVDGERRRGLTARSGSPARRCRCEIDTVVCKAGVEGLGALIEIIGNCSLGVSAGLDGVLNGDIFESACYSCEAK